MIRLIIFLTKLLLLLLTVLFFSSCNGNFGDGIKGNGVLTTESRNVTENFTKIDVSNGIFVQVEQADTHSISVKTDQNLQNIIQTKIEGDILTIYASEDYNSNNTPRVIVTVPKISELSAGSGSKISTKGILICNNLDVKASSGSTIEVDTETQNLLLDASSGSTIEGTGKALNLQTDSSSGSSVEAKTLLSNDVIADASSGSSTDIAPLVSLKASASSGSNITFFKNPKTIQKDISSGGSINAD